MLWLEIEVYKAIIRKNQKVCDNNGYGDTINDFTQTLISECPNINTRIIVLQIIIMFLRITSIVFATQVK